MGCSLFRMSFLGQAFHRPVTVQPLVQHTAQVQLLEKVMLKAALRSNIMEVKTFTIRNVNVGSIHSTCDLKGRGT